MRTTYDVIIVGFGPGGEVLTSTLGAAGLKVLVIDRWPNAYGLPRLTTLCGGTFRIVQATGINLQAGFDQTVVQEACNFVDAEGKPALVVPFPGELGGWPTRIGMFQPDIEKCVTDKVETMPNVTLMRGWEGAEMWFEGDEVHVIIAPTGGDTSRGKPYTVRAKYVVGADGARSFVRQSLGIGMTDYNLHERWFNFDTENLKPLPERFTHLRIYMDPERPHMYMPIGKRGLRFEYRVMEGETDEETTAVGVAEEFMRKKYGLDPKDFKFMRRVVYHYRTRMANAWSVGRAYLIGDAAHLMPPYLGQGAASSMRDARNLGWKLIEVLQGRSSDKLLSEYQVESEPYFRTLQMAATKLSDMVNMTDPVKANFRNIGMREHGEAKPPDLPNLLGGMVLRNDQGELGAAAGVFTPQARLQKGAEVVRADDVLGNNFQLWSRKDPSSYLGAAEVSYLQSIGCSFGVLADTASKHSVQEADGLYTQFLDANDIDVVIVRPDFYAFGGAKQAQANSLVKQLAQRLYSTHGFAA